MLHSFMLPLLHRQSYEAFRQSLYQARDLSAQATCDGLALKSKVAELQRFFQDRILSLSAVELEPEIEQRMQSYQVEINKQLQLLGIDILFLQAARQPETSEQRRSQVSDRLTTLIRYCEIMLVEEVGDESEGKEF